ncbi:MAG: hypothetical protein IKT47_05115 [Oscillospiraceae bacterium]|nr:hypothetical protein [Oscillospiraceae bacterium]
MKKSLILFLSLCMLLAVGCSAQNTPFTEPPAPTPTPSQTPEPASTPSDLSSDTKFKYPLSEDAAAKIVLDHCGEEHFFVKEIVPYSGDFLIELAQNNAPTISLFFWVFRQSGNIQQLTGTMEFTSYEIKGVCSLAFTHSGVNSEVPYKGMPASGTAKVHGVGDTWPLDIAEYPMWLDVTEPVYIGYWDGSEGKPADSSRETQLYDARIDANGLSFSFIPCGNSNESYQSFFPAVTTCPSFDIFMDGDIFTIRMYNTYLESGGVSNEDISQWPDPYPYPEYPYLFPEGSLGRDSHFVTDAEIYQDGSDTVVTCKLTEHAAHYQVESSNFGNDTIPYFRVKFRH